MNSVSPRLLLALLAPLLIAFALVSLEPRYNLPAAAMALVAIAAVWVAAQGSDVIAKALDRLQRAARNIRTGVPAEEPPENALQSEQRAFAELEKLAQELAARLALVEAERSKAAQLEAQLATRGESRVEASGSRFNSLLEVLFSVEQSIENLRRGLADQAELGEQVHRHTRDMSTALAEIAQHAEMLAGSAEDGSSAILTMTATNDQMAENIGELGASVRESVASIEEMTFSIKEVAKNVDALSLTAEETSSSMNEMDVSIDQVQSNANETARLSEEVARDAETGAEAILKTIGEIYRIKESSQEAVSVIANLGSKIDAIGQILNVIDEVAEQTNLLALNAAIIAAQAGEHGKGFAVVADEIKDLAERAGASTKEIADLIKTIQYESKKAIQAVEHGAQNVDRGVQVSNDAERALKKILESSQKSTNMVRAIARATVEQAKGSRQVTDAIGRIAETVQQIAAATAEQARGSELIMSSGEKMRTIAQQVERSSQEQSRGGRQITQAIEHMSTMVQQLNSAQRQQIKGSENAIRGASSLETGLRNCREVVNTASQQLQRARNLH
jgi:methyl-accepting chemotaxis protein